jgi:exosortase/archaeosortase family protein
VSNTLVEADQGVELSSRRRDAADEATQQGRFAKRVVASLLMLAAGACVVAASAFRCVEVWLCRRTFPVLGLGPTYPDQRDFFRFFATGTGDMPTRFTITPQCSALLLCVPLIAVAAMIVLSAQSSVRRTLVVLVGSASLLVVANQIRLALIGWTIRIMGFERGFPLSHLVLGTIVSLLGVAGSIAMLVRASRPRHAVG